MTTYILSLLNDDETYTDANNCKIVAVRNEDLGEGELPDAIEAALDADDFSYVATFELNSGVLTIHINDASGVPVVINDERQ